MDILGNPADVMSLASLILLLLFNAHRSLQISSIVDSDDDNIIDVHHEGVNLLDSSAMDMDTVAQAALQHWRLWNTLSFLDEDLGFWVKPRSTTWFSRFLLQEYDDERWVQMFRMSKRDVLSLADVLNSAIKKNDTNYRLAIPVIVRLACTLFKLSHGASLLVCSEMFAIGRSTISILLRDIVHAINVALRSEICWPSGDRLVSTVAEFQQLCGLPGVCGAIDNTHIPIAKPKHGSADYFYFKSGGYSINCQAIVDSSKRFLDLYVGMPGSTNDSRMLRRSSLFLRAQRNVLWDATVSFNGYAPYLLGDACYPLLPWLMVPHRQQEELPMADALFNKKMCRGRGVVENAFALLKHSFKELQFKSDLNIVFLPDVVICCALLHNLLLKQSQQDIDTLLQVLHTEHVPEDVTQHEGGGPAAGDAAEELGTFITAAAKRRELGLYLAVQRIIPM